MSNDVFLKFKSVWARIDVENQAIGVRVYQNTPETVALQLWSNGPTAANRNGKYRDVYSQANLNAQEIDALVRVLLDTQAKLPT